jgi:hypothetical protein
MEGMIFSNLLRNIEERKAGITDHLLSGGARNYEDYRAAVAQFTICQSLEVDIKELEARVAEM